MSKEVHQWGWVGVHPDAPDTWIPVFGKWCGPGWSAGERIKTFGPRHQEVSPVTHPHTGRESPIDALCKIHDLAYQDAEGKKYEILLKFQADGKLLKDLARLNKDELTQEEKIYSFLIEWGFKLKQWYIKFIHRGIEEQILTEADAQWMIKVIRAAMIRSEHLLRNSLTQFHQHGQTATKFFFPNLMKEIEKELLTYKANRKKLGFTPAKNFPFSPESAVMEETYFPHDITNIAASSASALFNSEIQGQNSLVNTQKEEFIIASINTYLSSYSDVFDRLDAHYLYPSETEQAAIAQRKKLLHTRDYV
jgi:hypothetical protein